MKFNLHQALQKCGGENGIYLYRIHPRGDIEQLLRHGLWSYNPGQTPGGYVDRPDLERWPGQDVEEPQTCRLYFATTQWNLKDTPDRFRLRVPVQHIEVEQADDLTTDDFGDYYVDTGARKRQVVAPDHIDIFYRGRWIPALKLSEQLKPESLARWKRHYKGPGFYGNRYDPDNNDDPNTPEPTTEPGEGKSGIRGTPLKNASKAASKAQASKTKSVAVLGFINPDLEVVGEMLPISKLGSASHFAPASWTHSTGWRYRSDNGIVYHWEKFLSVQEQDAIRSWLTRHFLPVRGWKPMVSLPPGWKLNNQQSQQLQTWHEAHGADLKPDTKAAHQAAHQAALTKIALAGEYWIVNGQAIGADADCGDIGHEGVIIEYILNSHSDEINALRHKQKLKPIYDITLEDIRDMYWPSLKTILTPAEYAIINEDQYPDARAYGVQHLNWIRTRGNNVQMKNLTRQTLRSLGNGLWDAGDASVETEEFFLEVMEPPAAYHDVPYTAIATEDPEAVYPYGERITRTPQPTRQAAWVPQLGERAFEVEWCSEIPIDPVTQDRNLDAAVYHVKICRTAEEALAFAKTVYPQDQFGSVAITPVELQDPYGRDIRRTFAWEYVGDSIHYDGQP